MASLLRAAEEQVDVVEAAMAPLSGLTIQPNLNTLAEALRSTPRDTGLDAGRVAEVLVQPGTQVDAGDLLVRFEGDAGAR
jgi:pyruvate carboxylase